MRLQQHTSGISSSKAWINKYPINPFPRYLWREIKEQQFVWMTIGRLFLPCKAAMSRIELLFVTSTWTDIIYLFFCFSSELFKFQLLLQLSYARTSSLLSRNIYGGSLSSCFVASNGPKKKGWFFACFIQVDTHKIKKNWTWIDNWTRLKYC